MITSLYDCKTIPTLNKSESCYVTLEKDEQSLDEKNVCSDVKRCHFPTPCIQNTHDDYILDLKNFACDNCINNNCNRLCKSLQDLTPETNCICANVRQALSKIHDRCDFVNTSRDNTSIDILFNKLYRNSAYDLNPNLSRNELLLDIKRDFSESQLCNTVIGISIPTCLDDSINTSHVLQNDCVSLTDAQSDLSIYIPVVDILVSTTNNSKSTAYLHRNHRNIYESYTNCCGNIHLYRDISRLKLNRILLDTNFVTTKLEPNCSCLKLCFNGSGDTEISKNSEPTLFNIHELTNCSYILETCNACDKSDTKPLIIKNNYFASERKEAEIPLQKKSRRIDSNVQTSVQKQLCTHVCNKSSLLQRKEPDCIKTCQKDGTCANQYIRQNVQKKFEKRAFSDGESGKWDEQAIGIQYYGKTAFRKGIDTSRYHLHIERILVKLFNSEGLAEKETVKTDKGNSKIKRKTRVQQIFYDATYVSRNLKEKQTLQCEKGTNGKDKEGSPQGNGKGQTTLCVLNSRGTCNSREGTKNANKANKEGPHLTTEKEIITLSVLKSEGTCKYKDNGAVQRSENSNEYTDFQNNKPVDKNKEDNSILDSERSELCFIDILCDKIILLLCQFSKEQLCQCKTKVHKIPLTSNKKYGRIHVKCNVRKFQNREKVKRHNNPHWIHWKDNATHTQENQANTRKRRINLQNRAEKEVKRVKRWISKIQQATCIKQDLYKEDNKPICIVAKGSLTFIGTLLVRAGIEQNPGPWNGHSNREELRQSENYVWKTGDALGRGATAIVYKARSKHTRDLFAVKVFHDRVSSQFANVALREIEVLRRLKHRNVISIFCTEQELNTGNFVLVMELCTGGSLYSMLDQPKFAFGFPEEEFLVVMKDIAEGMKYIRQQEYVHRDIKPGNIMRFIDENGSSVYKFTDFGAARQLDEEESFSSIYGTEEYLDPDMYQKAVLRQHIGTFFDASVDLWSLGVTIFHVATGFLPFQPYGGRKNTATMFKITSEKESGVISGIQSEENGPIRWSKELPRSCMLSSNLKALLTPMLAGMMESNRGLRWSFENFFDTVNTIVNMVQLKVFYSSRGCNFRIYIDGKSRFAALQEKIAMETEIPAFEQLLIFNNKELKHVVDATTEIQSYSKNIIEGQLFLFNKERYQQETLIIPEIITFPAIQGFINYDRDSSIAHSACAVAYYIDKVIAWLIDAQKLMQQADTLLRDHISRITSRIDDSLPDMYRLLGETNKRQATFYLSYEQVLSLYKIFSKTNKHSQTIGPICEEAETKLAKILTDRSAQDVIKKAENRAEEIKVYTSVLIEKLKEQEQEAISNGVGCLDTDKCLQKSKNLWYKIQEIWTTFQKHKRQPPTPHEQENHASDRMKLSEHCANLSYLLQSHCLYNYQTLHRTVVKQEFLLVKNIQRTKKVDANIWSVIECQGKLSARIDKLQEDCLALNKTYVDILTREMESSVLMTRGEMSMCTVGSDLSVDHPYTKMVQNIEKEFKALDDGSSELQKLVMKNDLKLREAKEFAEGFLKEMQKVSSNKCDIFPVPDSYVQNV